MTETPPLVQLTTKRPKNFCLEKKNLDGICTICLKPKPLSIDHVPPKCLGNDRKMAFKRLYPIDSGPNFEFVAKGLAYKTICEDCNGKMSDFDTTLSKVYNAIRNSSPSSHLIKLEFNMPRFLKSILGHFLAAKTTNDRSVFEEACAQVLIGNVKSFSQQYRLYLFYYPFHIIKVIRDIGLIAGDQKMILVNAIKIFPLAIIFTDSKLFNENDFTEKILESNTRITLNKRITINPIEPEGNEQFSKIFGQCGYDSIIGMESLS